MFEKEVLRFEGKDYPYFWKFSISKANKPAVLFFKHRYPHLSIFIRECNRKSIDVYVASEKLETFSNNILNAENYFKPIIQNSKLLN